MNCILHQHGLSFAALSPCQIAAWHQEQVIIRYPEAHNTTPTDRCIPVWPYLLEDVLEHCVVVKGCLSLTADLGHHLRGCGGSTREVENIEAILTQQAAAAFINCKPINQMVCLHKEQGFVAANSTTPVAAMPSQLQCHLKRTHLDCLHRE
jgi:hypothetical protein